MFGIVHPLVARLDQWLAANRPAFHASLRPGSAAAGIDDVAGRVDGELPSLLRELLTWRDGQSQDYDDDHLGCLDGAWRLMSAGGLAATMDEMLQIGQEQGFGVATCPDDLGRIEEIWWSTGWIPFLENIFGDNLCVDLWGAFGGTSGQIIEFRAKDEFRNITHPSLEAWLETLVLACEAGMYDEVGDIVDWQAHEAFLAARLPGYPIETDMFRPR